MKLSIRMKIFLPVVILLIGFPLATWATLRYSLEVHMNFNARREMCIRDSSGSGRSP